MEIIEAASGPRTAPLSEEALIRAAQRRDHDAFEQLVRMHDRTVLRVALNVLRSPDEAQDAYQEAFLKVYRNLGSFRFQCSFKTWLYRVTTNVCLDHLRRRNVRRERIVESNPQHEGPTALENFHDGRAESNPDHALESSETGRRIARAMELLTPKERLVFELKHFQGLKLRAIGETLGMSEEAAKNSMFRATRKLREALGGATA